MRKWTAILPFPALAAFVPALAAAADGEPLSELAGKVTDFGNFVNILIGFFVALAIVVFFWGLVKYLWGANSENAHEGLKLMFWGLIGILVMVSIWGLIALLQDSFNISSEEGPIRVQEVPIN